VNQSPKDLPVILLVEDRDDDVLFIKKAFERGNIQTAIQVARDGQEAIDYFDGVGRYRSRKEYPLPWLVLLDLKMPRVDGFEVLKWIRAREEYRSIVVVVLTASDQIRDVNQAYRVGANSFLVKPVDFENTANLIKLIHEYWLHHNRFAEAARKPTRELNGGKQT